MNKDFKFSGDERISQILSSIMEISSGYYQTILIPSEKDDDIDAIMVGMNMLTEEIEATKYIEELLKESEEQFRDLYENATIGLYRTSPDGEILLANKALVKMLGYASFEKLAERSLEKDGFDSSDRRKEFIEKIEKEGEVYNFESVWIRQDNTRVFIKENTRVIRDSEGKTLYYDGMVEDITERKLAENKLKESETRLKQISEGTEEWIWEVDTNGVFTYVNPYAKKLLGYAPDELIGIKHFYDYFEPEHKEELIKGALVAFVRKESIRNFINCNIHKDGRRIILSTSGFPIIDSENNFIGYRGINVDITNKQKAEDELKISETKFRSIVEGTKAILFNVNTHGIFTYLNEAACKKLEMTNQELLGKLYLRFVHPVNREKVHSIFSEQIKNPTLNKSVDVQIITKSGKEGWISFLINPIYAEGKIVGLSSIGQDITERKHTEYALSESEAKLTDAMEIAKLRTWEYNFALDQFTFNDHFYSLYNTTADQEGGYTMSSGQYAQRFVHPDDRVMVGKEIQKAFETSDPAYSSQMEYRVILITGEKGYFTANIRIEKDADNRTIKARGVNQDITDRKLAELNLKESEGKYKTLFENIPIGIGITDLTGKLVAFNDSLLEPGGYSRDDLIKLGSVEKLYYNLSDREIIIPLLKEKGTITQRNIKFKRKDGSPYDTLLSLSIIYINDIPMIQGVVEDITERKRAEEQIHESEYRYRNLFENAGIAIWEEDLSEVKNYIDKLKETGIRDFRLYFEKRIDEVIKCASLVKLLDVNNEVLHVVKAKSKEEVITSLPAFFIEESLDAAREEIIALAEGKMRIEGEMPIKIMDGEIRQILFQLTVVPGCEDTWEKVLFSFIDITERKQIEESLKLFRTLLDKSNDAIEVIDLETGQFIDVNERACTDLGYSRNELLSMNVQDIDPFQDKQSFQLLMQDVRQSSSTIVESLHRRKDGSVFPVEINIAVVKIVKTYTIAIVRDITERKKLETNLSTAAELAKLGYWEFEVKSGNFTFDDQYYRLIHGSSTEIQGGNIMSAEEFARRLVHPDDSKMIG